MREEPWNWQLADIEALINQAESLRLEFKSSKLLDETKNSRERITTALSAEVSAFANMEGGIIVIGINEGKRGKAKIAESIDDGLDISVWPPERLQGIIESNISPALTGIRIRFIPLNTERTQGVYVVYIPSGVTAYQASDRKYYGRSEYEIKPLPDHEIRLRMFRGKVPRAVVTIASADVRMGDEAIRNYPGLNRYFIKLCLSNMGEINISEYNTKSS